MESDECVVSKLLSCGGFNNDHSDFKSPSHRDQNLLSPTHRKAAHKNSSAFSDLNISSVHSQGSRVSENNVQPIDNRQPLSHSTNHSPRQVYSDADLNSKTRLLHENSVGKSAHIDDILLSRSQEGRLISPNAQFSPVKNPLRDGLANLKQRLQPSQVGTDSRERPGFEWGQNSELSSPVYSSQLSGQFAMEQLMRSNSAEKRQQGETGHRGKKAVGKQRGRPRKDPLSSHHKDPLTFSRLDDSRLHYQEHPSINRRPSEEAGERRDWEGSVGEGREEERGRSETSRGAVRIGRGRGGRGRGRGRGVGVTSGGVVRCGLSRGGETDYRRCRVRSIVEGKGGEGLSERDCDLVVEVLMERLSRLAGGEASEPPLSADWWTAQLPSTLQSRTHAGLLTYLLLSVTFSFT